MKLFFALTATLWATVSIRATDTNVLRIGYQKSGAFLLVKNQGQLEARLKPLGWTVEWTEFVAGIPLLEALAAGKLDIGHSGDAPAVFAQVAGAPLVYLAVTRPSPTSVGLLVPKGSTLSRVEDLKGKRVIFGKGSSAHFFVVKALETAGLALSDIVPIYLNPADARAAFERGEGDAWAVWDPYLASAEIGGEARILRNGEGLTPFREFYLAHSSFAQAHRKIVEVVLQLLEEVGAQSKKDPHAIAALLAPLLKIDFPTIEKAEYRKFRYGAAALSPAVVAEQQGLADQFFKLGLIPKKVSVADWLWQPAQ